ncbi:MAG: FixH family protein [Thaumarchaeota archaeon]|nr:FixH family protein [Nitrososphaerota archaeon]MBI3642028.1 FixH family protein [Nitrososphaerota archaeon]
MIVTAIVIAAVVTIAGLFSNTVFGLGCSPHVDDAGWKNLSTNSMMESGGMMSSMMNQVPKDVIIKIESSQQVLVGKEDQIKLLVLDKNTGNPLTDAQVTVGLEEGAPMSTMNMIGGMFNAENLGDGTYLAKFTLDSPGYYTLHTHVIPVGKSMHSMMDNHMDIGIIAK